MAPVTGLVRTVIALSGAAMVWSLIPVAVVPVVSWPVTGILRTFQLASSAVVITSWAVMASVVMVPSWCQVGTWAVTKAVRPSTVSSS